MSAEPLLKTEYITDAEYIAMEIASDVKHEYFNGEIYAMAGASAPHNDIAMSLGGEIRAQLRGIPCHPYGSDQRVKIEETGMRTYPDLSIACEPEFENDKQLDLMNPLVIFEILSPGTAAYDRGEKFGHYRSIQSLNEYILIEQNRPHIEQFIRQPDNSTARGGWLLLEYDGLDREIKLASVPCVLKLSEVYERIVFEETPSVTREHLNENGASD
jgi:Uma2 family endonuclease